MATKQALQLVRSRPQRARRARAVRHSFGTPAGRIRFCAATLKYMMSECNTGRETSSRQGRESAITPARIRQGFFNIA